MVRPRTNDPDEPRPVGEEPAAADAVGLDSTTERDRDRMRLAILLILAAAATYAIVRLLAPFTLAIVTSSVAAVLAYPAHRWLRAELGDRNGLSAGLVTGAAFLLVVLPLAGLLVVLLNGIESGLSVLVERFQAFTEGQGQLWHLLQSAASTFGIGDQELGTAVENQLNQLGGVLAGGTLGVLSGLGTWIVQAAIGLFTLFYLLRDGPEFVDVLRWIIPLERDITDALFDKTVEVVTATVLGALLVGALQGLAGGLLFWALGIPGPALWGAVMAFLGLLPMVGPPVVWIPTALLLLSSGQVTEGLILIAVGSLVIGTMDNVLRAILVGERARLHPLVVFFSVLGGVVVFGSSGFLFGPVLVVAAFSVLEIARVALFHDGVSPLSGDNTILDRITTRDAPALSASRQ